VTKFRFRVGRDVARSAKDFHGGLGALGPDCLPDGDRPCAKKQKNQPVRSLAGRPNGRGCRVASVAKRINRSSFATLGRAPGTKRPAGLQDRGCNGLANPRFPTGRPEHYFEVAAVPDDRVGVRRGPAFTPWRSAGPIERVGLRQQRRDASSTTPPP